mgnify:CR=1 FL=1
MTRRERRREGRRIRKQNREIMAALPAVFIVMDEVQHVDWAAVADTMAETFIDAQNRMLVWAADAAAGLVEMILASLCPDCRAGKHDACIGRAWSEATDEEVECPCFAAGHPPEVDDLLAA